MQSSDIGDMMNQFKQRKTATGEGITDANKLVSETQDTVQKAEQAPAVVVPEKKQEEDTDGNNVLLDIHFDS